MTADANPRWLSLADIAEARAYEREREAFRDRVIALKKRRRVAVGPVISLVFENRETIRFQVQEMARAERLISDEAIQAELDTYNPLIPAPGELSASLFIELTTRAEMQEWLPKLVGIERHALVSILPAGDAGEARALRCEVEEGHAAQLTREEVTAAVHFVRWRLAPADIDAFRTGTVSLEFDHPAYQEAAVLGDETRDSLLGDLLG
jgi:hypothetical protein